MKHILVLISIVTIFSANAQTKADSLQQIQQWAKWYDLDFITAESDSMLDNLQAMQAPFLLTAWLTLLLSSLHLMVLKFQQINKRFPGTCLL